VEHRLRWSLPQNPGFLLGAGNGLARWLENAESGSGVEKALYRLMKLPGGEIFYRRSPRETRPELTALINAQQEQRGALLAASAWKTNKALDFDAAEKTGRPGRRKLTTRQRRILTLADFYERRLKPQEELAALEAVGQRCREARASVGRRRSRSDRGRPGSGRLRSWIRYALPRAVAAAGVCRLGAALSHSRRPFTSAS
jgi:hypothetical protein